MDHLDKFKPIINELQAPNKMQCYSILIESENKKLLYSSDLASINPIEPYLENLDYLLIDSSHIDIDPLFEYVESDDVEQVILTHLNSPEDTQDKIEKAIKRGSKQFMVALDGMEIQLD